MPINPLRCTAAAVTLAALAAGCTSHPLAAVTPAPELESNEAFPIETSKKIDLLFVVDNSGSMREEQASLALNFPRFMQAIETGGLPDLQLAVISTDLGAGGIKLDKCAGIGDAGRFKAAANCPLKAGEPPFLKVDREGQKNFEGALTDAFACVATLGIEGCGYEHPLQSLRVALSSNNPHLAAFLRPDAHLGIIIISDEDDCSADFDTTLFNEARPGQAPNLRCATAGHVCRDQAVTGMAMSAPLASCRPAVHANDDASRRAGLINIETFVNHVKAMKGPGRRILVAGIYGTSTDAGKTYDVSGSGELDLQPICDVAGAGKAAPAVRLKAFVDAFGADGSSHSICGADLSEAMTQIGQAVAMVKPDTCLGSRPLDVDPTTAGLQVDCAVSEQDNYGTGAQAKPRLLPTCAPGGASPCWQIKEDTTCATSGVRLLIEREAPGVDGTTVLARCRGQAGAGRGTDGGP